MKGLLTIICALVLGFANCVASESASAATVSVQSSASYSASVPTGAYFNGNDFVRIYDDFVRISISGTPREYNIAQCEKDSSDNYALTLTDRNGNRASITVYPNRRSLIYNGVKYEKR